MAKNTYKPVRKPEKLVHLLRDFQHHRNGISGQAFYYVYFIGEDGSHLHAVIPVFAGKGDNLRFEPNQVYVINPLAPDACYRGDTYADELIPLLKTAIAEEDLRRYGIKTEFDK